MVHAKLGTWSAVLKLGHVISLDYAPVQSDVEIGVNTFRAVIAGRLSAYLRSQVGVGMNNSAIGLSVERLQRSNIQNTAPYKDIYLSRLCFDLHFTRFCFCPYIHFPFP